MLNKKDVILSRKELKALAAKNDGLVMQRLNADDLPVRRVRATLVGVDEHKTKDDGIVDVTLKYVIIDNSTGEMFVFEDVIERWDRYDLIANHLHVDVYPDDHSDITPLIYFTDLVGSVFDAQLIYEVDRNGVFCRLELIDFIVSTIKKI